MMPQAASANTIAASVSVALYRKLAVAMVFAACLAFLLLAASLDPNPAGIGTHCQLGLAPCGFVEQAGMPCATCGMTTAVSLAADGRLLAALRVQPAGATLAVAAAVFALLSGWSLFTGMALAPVWHAVWNLRSFVAVSVLVLGAWVYKIAVYHGMI